MMQDPICKRWALMRQDNSRRDATEMIKMMTILACLLGNDDQVKQANDFLPTADAAKTLARLLMKRISDHAEVSKTTRGTITSNM